MNRAKEAAAHSWRSTLSSGDGQEEGDKAVPPSQDPQPPPPPVAAAVVESKEGVDQPHPPPPQPAGAAVVKPVVGADRARLVEEFQQRRREAAANRQRVDAQWAGAGYSPRPLPKAPDQSGEIQCNFTSSQYLHILCWFS